MPETIRLIRNSGPAWTFTWSDVRCAWFHCTKRGNEYRILGDLKSGFWVARMFHEAAKDDGRWVAANWGPQVGARQIKFTHGTWTFRA